MANEGAALAALVEAPLIDPCFATKRWTSLEAPLELATRATAEAPPRRG